MLRVRVLLLHNVSIGFNVFMCIIKCSVGIWFGFYRPFG